MDGIATRNITASEYHRMGETGLIGPAERTELIEGEIIKMAPIGSPHVGSVFALTRILGQAATPDVVVSVQCPVHLDEHNEPEPDIALIRARADGYRQPPLPSAADVLLLIEVAESSLRHDRERKLPLYARHAIPEVWIIDLAARSVQVYRAPSGNEYQQIQICSSGEAIAVAAIPGLILEVDDLI